LFVAVVSIIGVFYLIWESSAAGKAHAEERLHTMGSIVQVGWSHMIIFGICIVLAFVIGALGYSLTGKFVESQIVLAAEDDSTIEPS
jgi:hypothetical protein